MQLLWLTSPLPRFLAGSPVLAHQGGWDEALMVIVPLGCIFFLLRLANKRVSNQLEGPEGPDSPDDPTAPSEPTDSTTSSPVDES